MKAISIRQPWAWLILHGSKRYENRLWSKNNTARAFRGPVLIHASAGMTQDEYNSGAQIAADNGDALPPAAELQRGGIVGQVDFLQWHDKPPAMPYAFTSGFVIAQGVKPLAFWPCKGALGFFNPVISSTGEPEPPAKWMPKGQPAPSTNETPNLL